MTSKIYHKETNPNIEIFAYSKILIISISLWNRGYIYLPGGKTRNKTFGIGLGEGVLLPRNIKMKLKCFTRVDEKTTKKRWNLTFFSGFKIKWLNNSYLYNEADDD